MTHLLRERKIRPHVICFVVLLHCNSEEMTRARIVNLTRKYILAASSETYEVADYVCMDDIQHAILETEHLSVRISFVW